MTTHYQITKHLRRMTKMTEEEHKIENYTHRKNLKFCMCEDCFNVKYRGEWTPYRKLAGYEKEVLSSGLCPRCEINMRRHNGIISQKKFNVIFDLCVLNGG